MNTLRMTDVTIFRELKAELRKISGDIARNEAGSETEGTRAIMRRFQEVLGRSNMDSKEAEALKGVVETVLRVGSKAILQGDQYKEELQRLYSGRQFDTQYEKVREDAKHRWVAFYQNLAISSASKALAVATAPIGGFLAATFGVAALETAGQAMTKWNMENRSLTKKVRDLKDALNKELQGFDTIDSNNIGNPKPLLDGANGRPQQANQLYDPSSADPLHRAVAPKDAYTAALSAYRSAETNKASNPTQLTNQALDQAWNDLARSAFLYVSNADRVKNMLEAGGKLSMATRHRYQEVQETAETIVNDLKDLHRARFGEELTRETFCQTLRYGSSGTTASSLVRDDQMVIHADFVSRVHEEERGNLDSFQEAKLKEVRDQVLDWKRNIAQFTLNSFGNAMAIFAAGIRAIPESEALQGSKAIPVVDGFMKLEDYISEHATKSFNKATGLDKLMPFDLGEAIGTAVGKQYAELTSWTGHLLHQQSNFNPLSVGERWDSFNEIWAKGSPQVGDFLDGGKYRYFNFNAGAQTMQKACEYVANVGMAGAGVLAAASSLIASRVDRTTQSTYHFTQGFLPPVFVPEHRTPPVKPAEDENTGPDNGGSTEGHEQRQIANGSGQVGNGSGAPGEYPRQWPGVDPTRFGNYWGEGSNPYTGTFLGIRPDVLAERGLGEDGQPLPQSKVAPEPTNTEPTRESGASGAIANGSGGPGLYPRDWPGVDQSRFGSYRGPGANHYTGTFMGLRPDVLAERGLGEDGQPLQPEEAQVETTSPRPGLSEMREDSGAKDQPYSPLRMRKYRFTGELEGFEIGIAMGAWGSPDARERRIEFKAHAGVDPRLPGGVSPSATYIDVTKSDEEWKQIFEDEDRLLRIFTLAVEDLREGRSLKAFDDYSIATK